jgi:hypothetical protein
MKRRGFLAALPFLAPAVAMAVPGKPADPDDFEWEGYRVKWRDYVGEHASDRLEGFWTAWPLVTDKDVRKPYVFSMTSTSSPTYPTVGRYNLGDTFPMGYDCILRSSTDTEKAAAKLASLDRLKQFILDEKKPKPEPGETMWFLNSKSHLFKFK